MLRLVRRSMSDSAVARSFRLVVDRVEAAARRRPAVCLSALTCCELGKTTGLDCSLLGAIGLHYAQ